ncbi:MAG: glycosyl transferase family protein [Atribacterota bacterium]
MGIDLLFLYLISFCAVTFFISGVDELFFDFVYVYKITKDKVRPKISIKDLDKKQQQPIAIMIPAWHEADVVRKMIENNLQGIDYLKYNFFIGVYPNDQDTLREVEKLTEKYPFVYKAVTSNQGPTNKANNLNNIYNYIAKIEQEKKIKYKIVVIHDSEDIIHPKELKLFNYYIPEYTVVQAPVFPLEMPAKYFTYGCYIDDFSEHHMKEMIARNFIRGYVPTAGVGAAFNKDALEELKQSRGGELFNEDNLTEDYEIGIKLGVQHKKSLFVTHGLERTKYKKSLFSKKKKLKKTEEIIATREYFPTKLIDSLKQKSRWTIGITMQSWKQLGWFGSIAGKYTLFHDRKTLITNFVNLLAYFVFGYAVIRLLLSKYAGMYWNINYIIPSNTFLWWLIIIDTGFLFWRLGWKFYCVNRIYGKKQAFVSIPRSIWRNVVGFLSNSMAVYYYVKAIVKKQQVQWIKTKHYFPSRKELEKYKAKLGDLLLENRLINIKQLDQALRIQGQLSHKRKLGEILIDLGYINEEDFVRMYCQQINSQCTDLDPYSINYDLLKNLPRTMVYKYGIIPIKKTSRGNIVIASSEKPDEKILKQLEDIYNSKIEFRLATKSDTSFALDRVYLRFLDGETEKEKAGQILLDRKMINQEQLDKALKKQRREGGKLGEILVDLNFITQHQLNNILRHFFNMRTVELKQEYIDYEILDRIPYPFLKIYNMAPIKVHNDVLLGTSRPQHDKVMQKIRREYLTDLEIEQVLMSESDLQQVIEIKEERKEPPYEKEDVKNIFEWVDIEPSKIDKKIENFDLKEIIEDSSIVPIQIQDTRLTVAVSDPIDINELRKIYQKAVNYKIYFVISSRQTIEKARKNLSYELISSSIH